jgi:class 3 adenylate cyclase
MGTTRRTNALRLAAAPLQAASAQRAHSAPVGHGAAAQSGVPMFLAALQTAASDAPLADWARSLELRLAEQTKEIARLSRLKRFLSPQLVDLILSDNADELLKSHRREIVVVFVDLRGFTAFAETAAPEDLSEVLSEYHQEVGDAALEHGGTLERFTGDGVMIFFNDPVPIAEPAQRALQMALDVQARLQSRCASWQEMGHELDFGIGVAQGYATIGPIGFEGRWDYAAIGTVTNLASRLCSEAKLGQILISRRTASALQDSVEITETLTLELKGFRRSMSAERVVAKEALRRKNSGKGHYF